MPPQPWPRTEGVIDTVIGFSTDPEQLYAGIPTALQLPRTGLRLNV
jgi:hypothetical protein